MDCKISITYDACLLAERVCKVLGEQWKAAGRSRAPLQWPYSGMPALPACITFIAGIRLKVYFIYNNYIILCIKYFNVK